MPQLGEKKYGFEIGKTETEKHKFTWVACSVCGHERWTRLKGDKKISEYICQVCNGRKIGTSICLPLTEKHKRKIGEANSREKHYNWKGGRSKGPDGYIRV